MKKIQSLIVVAVTSVFLISVGYVSFAAHHEKQEIKTMGVELQGENYCVACTLGNAGANSSCSTVGHKHALKVAVANDSAGSELSDLKGKTVHYLYNTNGKEYVDGHHGEQLTVTGKLFIEERVIDIAKVEPTKKES